MSRAHLRPPLDEYALRRLAIAYVGRYATTKVRLAGYLTRKLRERDWGGEGAAPVDAIVEHCAALGFVDDAAFAVARSAILARRGYGARRIGQTLAAAGIARDLAATCDLDEGEAFDAALAFAKRRRIGPFAVAATDDTARRRALGAMIRAGHDLALARRFIDAAPGIFPERDAS